MCGLVGVFHSRGDAEVRRGDLQRGCDAIAHRGPDDSGIAIDGPCGLGFRRLSILDLHIAGHQPMTSADGAWTIVFNGEIYNFLELRRELVADGLVLRSESDTEVLLELLARDGVACLPRLNGMWAFLAWHAPTRTMFACRDPWGIKPLYLCEAPDGVVFASEIKAMIAMGLDLGPIDGETALTFLADHELDVDERTMWRGVRSVRPGELLRLRSGEPIARGDAGADVGMVDPTLPVHGVEVDDPLYDAACIESFREAFISSVRLRMRADVAAGTCLSGGLDSTSIACATASSLGAERSADMQHAFTFLAKEFDESRYIEPVVAKIGARWHVAKAEDDVLIEAFPAFRRAHDLPVHSLAAFAGFLLMRLAAQAGVRVLLNGQGSDELLAGYPSSRLPWLRSLVRQEGVAAALEQAALEAGSRAGGLQLLGQAIAGLGMRGLPPALETAARTALQRRHHAASSPMWRADGPLGQPPLTTRPASMDLQRHLDANLRRSPLPLYLRVEDINSSALSIEARLPFLDPVLVGLARQAPARLLRRDGRNKYLLRAILPGLVPQVVWQRADKMGFPVPQGRWLRGPLRPHLDEILDADALAARGWYDVPAVIRARDAFLADAGPSIPPPLLRVFLLEMWARDHFDRAAQALAGARSA